MCVTEFSHMVLFLVLSLLNWTVTVFVSIPQNLLTYIFMDLIILLELDFMLTTLNS